MEGFEVFNKRKNKGVSYNYRRMGVNPNLNEVRFYSKMFSEDEYNHETQGVMFSFNTKEKKAFFIVEDDQEENFVARKRGSFYSFKSKELCEKLMEIFEHFDPNSFYLKAELIDGKYFIKKID